MIKKYYFCPIFLWCVMGVIYMLISISTLVAGVFLFLFFKAVKEGQYEDLQSPSVRMLFEDELVETPKQDKQDKEENT